jgi:hypothetical protein
MSGMKKFNEILPTLDNAGHVQRILLFKRDGSAAGVIENKAGSQGSIRVYHHLYKKWGVISVDAAQEGLVIYAEHTEDAKLHKGKHPNIDRLLEVVANHAALTVTIVSQANFVS